jgi:hypothetical protein
VSDIGHWQWMMLGGLCVFLPLNVVLPGGAPLLGGFAGAVRPKNLVFRTTSIEFARWTCRSLDLAWL